MADKLNKADIYQCKNCELENTYKCFCKLKTNTGLQLMREAYPDLFKKIGLKK